MSGGISREIRTWESLPGAGCGGAAMIHCGYERWSFVGGGLLWGNVSAGNGCGKWVLL
jgi:hypothetical protein